MPESITQAFVQQWDTQIRLESGQSEARFMNAVTDRGQITGESFTANMLDDDQGELDENTVRHGDTVWSDIAHLTPVATMQDYYKAYPVDKADEPKLLANPSGPYMDMLIRNRNRRCDKIIYNAARGTQVLKDGSSEVLPASQKIAHGGTGMTKSKIIEAKKIFRGNEADEHEGEELYITYDSRSLEDILADTTLTSADFLAVKMLQNGDISGKWMGFNWIPYEKLATADAGATFFNVAWSKSGIQFGSGFVEGNVQRRGDKKDTLQVSMAASYGALRTEAKRVVEIAFQ
jgi:hypothetical protein